MVRLAACLVVALAASGAAWAQEKPIVGQDAETAGRGSGPTGWVQAPEPRGINAPQQEAQGAGAKPVDGSAPPAGGGQGAPGQNPGTPVADPLPKPAAH